MEWMKSVGQLEWEEFINNGWERPLKIWKNYFAAFSRNLFKNSHTRRLLLPKIFKFLLENFHSKILQS